MAAEPWRGHALLLVDLQRDFWTPDVAATEPELPQRVAGLLSHARSVGLLVVHVRARFRPDGSDWMPRHLLRGRVPCIDGTPGAAPLPFAAELPGETVITKQSFDAFLGTELDDVLDRQGVRSLMIAGLVTSTCVLFTAAAAMQRGYLVSVVADCCSDGRDAHLATLSAYPHVFDVIGSDEIDERRLECDADLDRLADLRPLTRSDAGAARDPHSLRTGPNRS